VALGRRPKRGKGRANVGTFEPPPERPTAPIDHVIEDAMMIARSGVRLSVRNSIIVDALRDGLPYDDERLAARARVQYLELAAENEADADRVERQRLGAENRKLVWPDGRPAEEDDARRRRPQVHRAVADALRAVADQPEQLATIVREATGAAWDDVARALTQRVLDDRERETASDDPGKPERLRRLIEVDLTDLELQAAERRALDEAAREQTTEDPG